MFKSTIKFIPFLGVLVLFLTFSPAGAGQSAPASMEFFFEEIPEQDQVLTASERDQIERQQKLPTTKRLSVARVKLDLKNQASLRINLFRDKEVIGQQSSTMEESGFFTWVGKIQGAKRSQMFIIQKDAKIIGQIWMDHELFSIYPLEQGRVMIIDVDQSKFGPDESEGAYEELLKRSQRPADPLVANAPKGHLDTADDGSELRVLIAYANFGFPGGIGNSELFGYALITSANYLYANSNIAPRVKLAYNIELFSNDSGGDLAQDLAIIKADPDIQRLRDDSGADMVVYMVADNGFGICGLADEIRADENTAFAVVNQACALPNYSFAHEMAHLQGARHDPYMDPAIYPFTYGHGYVDVPNAFRTVMAQNNECIDQMLDCLRIPYFSNPDVDYIMDPTGTAATHDNARVLDETAIDIANFRVLPDNISNGGAYVNTRQEDSIAAKNEVIMSGSIYITERGRTVIEAPSVKITGTLHAFDLSGVVGELLIHTGYK